MHSNSSVIQLLLYDVIGSFRFARRTASATVKHETWRPKPRWLSGPLRVVELGGLTDNKFDACAHE